MLPENASKIKRKLHNRNGYDLFTVIIDLYNMKVSSIKISKIFKRYRVDQTVLFCISFYLVSLRELALKLAEKAHCNF